MSQQRLLEHFDRISEAPDAIPRLRRFILELAIRGKLVEHDPKELIAVPIWASASLDEPFNVPPNWRWQKLESLTKQITDGEHATPQRIPERQVPLVTAKNVRNGLMDYTNTDWVSFETASKAWQRCCPQVGDILLVCVGATTGRLCILRERKEMVLVRSVALIRPAQIINVDFLSIALRSPLCQKQIWAKVKASAQPCLYINRIKSLVIPLPSLAEQHRIVEKVDELMKLCDELEAAQSKREKRRDRLVSVTLRGMNNGVADNGNGESFSLKESARFYFNHLRRLTTRRDHVQQLRQTILNLAVRGKLVPQDSSDEPAWELLKRIETEKNRGLETGTIKKAKYLSERMKAQPLFAVSHNWAWARFSDVAVIRSNLVKPEDYPNHPHIAPDNIEGGTGKLLPYRLISEDKVFSAKHLFFPGHIIYSKIRPNLAKAAIVNFEGLCSADAYPIYPLIHIGYLLQFMLSEVFVRQSVKEDNRVAMPKINQEALNRILIAVPPLGEQSRIASKVTELMTVCDEMEAGIIANANISKQLLEANMTEALNG